MNLKTKTASGISWVAVARIGKEGLGFLTILILVRLLTPEDFGLLGMVTIFTGFVTVFQNLGLGSSIIQDKKIDQEQLSGIFWLNTGFSILVTLITIASAPLVANFYAQPAVAPILMILALNFPIIALSHVSDALLRKRMSFKQLIILQFVAMLAGSILGIVLALMGLGVWALVWQRITTSAVGTVLNWIVLPWRPSWMLSYRKVKKHIDFGLNLQTSAVLNYGIRNIDDLLIGKFIGAGALGVYQMAYRLMLWPLQHVSREVGQVMFPVLSSIQEDHERVKRVFLRAVSSIALIAFPMSLSLWVIAPSAVHTVLGEKWADVIPILRVLTILGPLQSVATNTSWIYLSQGRADLMLRVRAVFSVLYVACFVIGLQWGALGVAIGYAIANMIAMPINLQIAGHLVNMTFIDAIKAVSGVFFCTAGMVTLVWGIGLILPPIWPQWTHLIIQIALGGAMYGALLHIFDISAYRDVRQLLMAQLEPLRPMTRPSQIMF